jgi:hypothetical protein
VPYETNFIRRCEVSVSNPTIGPLLPTSDLATPERAKAAGAFIALVLAARVAPQTLGPIARVGLGVEIAEGAGLGTSTLIGPSNLLPQPFGFVPASEFGLTPNFFLPSGVGANLPSVVPGADAQRAERADAVRVSKVAQADAEVRRITQIQFQRGTPQLEQFQQFVTAPGNPGAFHDPALLASAIQVELDARERQRLAANAAIAARQSAAAQGATVATDPQTIIPGVSPNGQTGPVGASNQQAPGIPRPPSGFVEVPQQTGAVTGLAPAGGILGNSAIFGPGVQAYQQYRDRFNKANQGGVPDKFFQVVAGDP